MGNTSSVLNARDYVSVSHDMLSQLSVFLLKIVTRTMCVPIIQLTRIWHHIREAKEKYQVVLLENVQYVCALNAD